MTNLIAIKYTDDWVLCMNCTLEEFNAAPPPTATQALTEDWTVVDA